MNLFGADSFLFNEQGQVILAPGLVALGDQDGREIFYQDIFETFRDKDNGTVIYLPQYKKYMSLWRIKGPDWIYVTSYSTGISDKMAFQVTSLIVILGVFSLLIMITSLYFILRRLLILPLNKIATVAGQIADQNYIGLDPITSSTELHLISTSLNVMSQRIRNREENLQTIQEKLRLSNENLENRVHNSL